MLLGSYPLKTTCRSSACDSFSGPILVLKHCDDNVVSKTWINRDVQNTIS